MAIGSTLSVGLIGLKAFIVQVQAFISPGLPYFSIIGLPDASLSEARERVKSACQATGFGWPQTRVTVNMSPAAMPKDVYKRQPLPEPLPTVPIRHARHTPIPNWICLPTANARCWWRSPMV